MASEFQEISTNKLLEAAKHLITKDDIKFGEFYLNLMKYSGGSDSIGAKIQALYHLLLPVYTKYKHDYHIRIGLMIPGDSMVYQHYLDLYQGFNYMDVEPYAAHAFKQYDLIFTSSFFLFAYKRSINLYLISILFHL